MKQFNSVHDVIEREREREKRQSWLNDRPTVCRCATANAITIFKYLRTSFRITFIIPILIYVSIYISYSSPSFEGELSIHRYRQKENKILSILSSTDKDDAIHSPKILFQFTNSNDYYYYVLGIFCSTINNGFISRYFILYIYIILILCEQLTAASCAHNQRTE